jgi:hypothetical protein
MSSTPLVPFLALFRMESDVSFSITRPWKPFVKLLLLAVRNQVQVVVTGEASRFRTFDGYT